MDNKALSQKVSELEKRIAALENATHPSAVGDAPAQQKIKQLSPKEFLLSRKLVSAVDKTLALAFYLERVEKMVSFNINDLAAAFQTAKEKTPTNLHDMINKNIAKGYLMPAKEQKDSKKAWELTATGEIFVENDLNN